MRRPALPDYRTLPTEQLRALWRRVSDEEVRLLILEVVHTRALIDEIEAYRIVIDRCWREETGSTLVALEKIRVLLSDERSRLGETSVPPPAPDNSNRRAP